MSGPSDLHDLCLEYLGACQDALLTTPGGAIDRAYVSPGPPPWDCEQLTVYAGGPAVADTLPLQPPLQPGMRDAVTGRVNLVALTATVIRCTPVVQAKGRYPAASAIQASAEKLNADLWAIWNVVKQQYKAGTLFQTGHCSKRELFFDPAVALSAAGGFAGWQIQIRVQLDGYSE